MTKTDTELFKEATTQCFNQLKDLPMYQLLIIITVSKAILQKKKKDIKQLENQLEIAKEIVKELEKWYYL